MPDGKVVAIHQPNFFPWLGYFNKIAHADVFVILDNVQFSKTGGTWSNRVRLTVNGTPNWVTMPVVRTYEGVRLIQDMAIRETGWRPKLLQTLHHSYKQAAFFNEVYPVLATLIENPTDRVVDYNVHAIRSLARLFEWDDSKFVLGSALNVEGKATDLLIAIVKAVGGTAYLCGGGATDYQEDEKFAAEGLRLIYQDFRHPLYQQGAGTAFTPGLSIIDALMHCGFSGTHQLITTSEPTSSSKATSGRPVAAR